MRVKRVRVAVRMGAALALALVGTGVLPGAARAQEEPAGLAFVAGLGHTRGGPGPALVDGLIAAGMNGTRLERCVGCDSEWVDYPFYFDEGIDLAGFAGARYNFGVPLTVEVLVSNGPRGHAEGYRAATRDHLIIRYASFLLTGALSTHLGPVGVEGGPALAYTAWETTLNAGDSRHAGTWSVGTHAALQGRFYTGDVLLTLRTGGRWIPSTDLRNSLSFSGGTDYRAYYVSVTVSPWIDY